MFQTKRTKSKKNIILAALQQNGYPKEFIQRTIKKNNRRKEQPREHPEEEPKQTKSINLPYIQRVSEQLKRLLNKHIKATFYTHQNQRAPYQRKTGTMLHTNCNCKCKDCKAVYVGETKRTLNIRAEEHITAIKSASKRSHTAEHCWKYNHDFDWEHRKVLDFEKKLENKNHQGGNLLRRKRALYQWNVLQITKYLETNTARKQIKENSRQNYSIINLSPQRSANTSMVTHRSATKVNQSETTLKYFDPPRTQISDTHSHTLPILTLSPLKC